MRCLRLLILLVVLGAAGTASADHLRVLDPVPATRAFGNVPLGATPTATVTIASCKGALDANPCDAGGAGVTITSFGPDGAGCPRFSILTPPALPLALNNGPAGAAVFTVGYTPVDRAGDSCTFTVNASGGQGTSFTVTGTGVAAQLTVESPTPPDALAFADQPYNTGTGETRTITVRNTGNEDITEPGIVVSLSNATHFSKGALTPSDGSFPIGPNETATVDVTFNPTSIGDKAATVTFAVGNDGGEADKVVNLTGKGTQSVAGVPASVVFAAGAVAVARDANLVVSNTGDAPLNLAALDIAVFPDGDDFEFTDQGCTGQSCAGQGPIAPGGSRTFVLRCTPGGAGWRGGVMTITSDDGTTGARTVALKCRANALDLGSDKLGAPATAPQNVTISNPKSTPITYSISSSAPAEFVLSCPAGCAGRMLAAGASDTVAVSFQAAATGNRSANLTLATVDDGDINNTTVAVTGVGTQPEIAVDPLALAFGQVPVVQVGGATADVTVENTGDAPMVISAMNLVNDPTDQFSFATVACPDGHACTEEITIEPGEDATVTVRCDPTSAGDKTASLSILHDAPNAPTVVPLTCTGTVPDVELSALLVAFGDQRVGTTTAPPLTFTVANAAGPSAPMDYTVSLPGGTPFAIECSPPGCTGTLAAGESITVSVTFTPGATGLEMANITVDTPDDPDEPSTTVMVTGTGTEPSIAVAPSPLAFGDVPVAQVGGSTVELTVDNAGGAPLLIMSMAITDDAAGAFSFATAACPGGATCDEDLTVPAGDEAAVTVRCDPSSVADLTATLTLVSDAPSSPTVVTLTCRGTVPDVAVSAASLDFGDQRLNTASAPARTFTVSNGAAPATAPLAYSIAVTPGDFAIACGAPGCTGTLAAGESVEVSVTFTPTALGARAATITVTTPDDPDEAETTVALTGTGVEPGVAVDAPVGPLALGDVDVDATSAPGTVTLRNTGTSDLSISAVSLLGADAGQFAIATGATGAQTLAAGAGVNTRSWTITCTPTTIGDKTATFRVTHDAPAPGTHTDVALSCTGRAAIFVSSVVPPARLDFGQVEINTMSAPQTFTLTNTGNKPGRVTMLTSTSNEFVPSTMANLANDIAPGASITVSVVFQPVDTNVEDDEEVCALNNGLSTPVCVDVLGDGFDVGLDVQPVLVDFGPVRFDAAPVTSAPVTITNTGESSLRVDGITSSGVPFTVTDGPVLPLTLAFGQTATFRVVLTPTAALGTVDRTVTVNGVFTVSGAMASSVVDLRARIIAPQVGMVEDMVDFGPFDVDDPGTPVTRDVVITNIGDAATGADLHIGEAALQFGGPDFTIVNPAAVTVAPGASHTLTVRFAPGTAGLKTGRVTMAIDAVSGMTYTVSLRGLAIDQNVACNPATVSFPETIRRVASEPITATVSNLDFATGNGTAAMLSYTATITGDHAGDFAFPAADGAGQIAGNAMKSLPITFTPTAAGPRTAQLVVSYQDGGQRSCMITLNGDGRLRRVNAAPIDIDFGTVAVGSTVALSEVASVLQLMSAEASSSPAATVTRVAPAGAGAAAFTVVDGDQPQTLPGGQTVRYDVQFSPDEAGVFQAELQVFFDGDPEPHASFRVQGRAVDLDLHGGGCDGGAGGASLLVALAALGLRRRARRTAAHVTQTRNP